MTPFVPMAAIPPFRSVSELVRQHAQEQPAAPALDDGEHALTYAELDRLMDRVAAALQRDGLRAGQAVALCAAPSVRYAAVFLGALRAGIVVAPLAPSVTPAGLRAMLRDAQARFLFIDDDVAAGLDAEPDIGHLAESEPPVRIALDDYAPDQPFDDWLAEAGVAPAEVEIGAQHPFSIIYSSGTTGTPKGIVHAHGMRWSQIYRAGAYGYGPGRPTLLATPLYSNTTLTSFFPTLGWGGCAHLTRKFDARAYLERAQRIRATHTMLVPVQYQRLMAHPAFGAFDLSSFLFKFCTSAPFHAALKAEVLERWPGGLVEYYGMTEGGGSCILEAHLHPDKLHTVGRPSPGSDIRLIDDAGRELPRDSGLGEVVGASPSMMTGYHRLPDKTREAEWFDSAGKRFIRTGDIGRFDADGFLILVDRRKDMVISGGFNIYPSDIEGELRGHAAVADVAVFGVPSEQWGETPVAAVVLRERGTVSTATLLDWYNARAGKTQRLSDLRFVDELPRSAIGKVLKRELREAYLQALPASAR